MRPLSGIIILIVVVISFAYQEYFFVHPQFYKSDISMSEKFFGVHLVHYISFESDVISAEVASKSL